MNIPGINESGRDTVEIDGPGKRLRSIREQQQLDITKIAARLHLGVAQLRALEEDAYNRLPAAVFVRGYLRNYARILGEPADEILAAYAAINPGQGEPAKLIGKPPSTDTKISCEHGVVRLTTWVIVLLLVAAGALWSHGYLQEAGRQIADKIESVSPVITSISGGGREEQPQALLEPFLQPSESPRETVVEPVAIKAAVIQEEESTDLQPASPAPSPEPLPEPQVEAESMPVVEVSSGSIIFEFTGTSWIEVLDAKGKVKLRGELAAGDRRKLRGKAPFGVTVGNVQAVNLMVDGRPLDLAPYTRHSVAKFTLDSGGAR